MEIMTADAYNTMTLRRLLRQNGAMSRQDRAFVTEVVNGTLRNLIYIDHVLNTFSKTKTEKMKPWLLAVLRTAVYQMYFMDVPDAAACNEAVKLASVRGYGSLKGFVNGVLRTAAKKKQAIPLPERGTAEYLSVAYSHPLWLVRMWIAYYGYEETEQICAYDNQSPDVTIRVNTLKTNTQALKKKLEQAGVHVAESRICADALHLTKTADLSRLDTFKEGLFHVQDDIGGIFDQGLIVGDKENGQLGFHNKTLQPMQGGDIQIIGGLVQKQNIRVTHTELCKLHFHLFSPRQRFQLLR